MVNVTFVDYLLNEDEAGESAKMGAIRSSIKTVVNNFLTSVADDEDQLNHRMLMGREVFDTLKDVAEDRLSGEQTELSRGRLSKGGYEEWKDDEKGNFALLWKSIEAEMAEAVEQVLMPDRNADGKTRAASTTAIRHIKNHIVGPFIDMLQQYKPEEAKEHYGHLLDEMEREWNTYSRQVHPDDAQVARNMLMQHQRERNRKLSARNRKSITRKERKAVRDTAIEKAKRTAGGAEGRIE